MKIYAPYPSEATLMFLPEPQVQNSSQPVEQRQHVVMMDKTVYGYTKSTGITVHSYSFHITREKSEEVREFVQAYYGELWRVIDHNDLQIIGYCLTNLNEFRYVHPHAGHTAKATGYTLNEKVVWDLEFEEAS